jgi:hypothetical protein
MLVIISLISACGITPSVSEFLSPEVEGQTQEQLAILDWRDCLGRWGIACTVSVQRKEGEQQVEMVSDARNYNQAKLPPGTYTVRVFEFLTGGKYKDIQGTVLQGFITLKPGRKYLVNKSLWSADVTAQYWAGATSWWIEDAESGVVLTGAKPPEHLPGFKYNPFWR